MTVDGYETYNPCETCSIVKTRIFDFIRELKREFPEGDHVVTTLQVAATEELLATSEVADNVQVLAKRISGIVNVVLMQKHQRESTINDPRFADPRNAA